LQIQSHEEFPNILNSVELNSHSLHLNDIATLPGHGFHLVRASKKVLFPGLFFIPKAFQNVKHVLGVCPAVCTWYNTTFVFLPFTKIKITLHLPLYLYIYKTSNLHRNTVRLHIYVLLTFLMSVSFPSSPLIIF
jgi:hypothetical protein